MSTVYVGNSAKTVETSPAFDSYTGVSITVDGNEKWTAGDATGRVLTVENPYGSPQIAESILKRLQTNNYQPLTITSTAQDPAMEIGDAVSTNGAFNGAYSIRKTFGRLITSDISAEGEEEVDHEFPYETNSQYVTFTGLRNGTTDINGAGILDGTITGDSVADRTLTGDNMEDYTITSLQTDGWIGGGCAAGYSANNTLVNWISGSGGDVEAWNVRNFLGCRYLAIGDYEIEVPSGLSGYLMARRR